MHTVKITIDCLKDDDPKWGTTTTHEVRELTYEKLVTFQRELFDGLGEMLLGHGESKVLEATGTPTPNTFTR
jgi:hypothetical protein